MKLVPNARHAWKWFSVQAIALATIWEGIPEETKAVIPEPYVGWITLGLLILAGIGRMIDQETAKQ